MAIPASAEQPSELQELKGMIQQLTAKVTHLEKDKHRGPQTTYRGGYANTGRQQQQRGRQGQQQWYPSYNYPRYDLAYYEPYTEEPVYLIMASCPSNSIFDPNRHLCYWPSSDRQSFQEHEVYCEGDNGIVITIDSNQTETFINETIPWDIWFAHDHEPNYDIFIGRIDVFRNKHFYQLESIPLVSEAIPLVSEAIPLVSETIPLVSEAIPLVSEVIPLVSETIPLVSEAIPLVSEAIPLVSEAIPLVSEVIPLVSEAIPLVCEAIPLVSEAIPLDHTIFSNITSNQDSLDCCILDGSGAPMMDACSAKQQAICSIDASSQSDCPTQGKFYDYRCYWPLTTSDSAENQLVSCSNDSGTLAIFHNLSTIDQVVAEFSNWSLSTPWIGINDLDTEGIYKESFEIKYNTFAPWAQNEPGDITTQRCVERWSKDGFWNDLTCIESKLSICQKRGTMPETTTELSIPSTGSETSTESATTINTLSTSTGSKTCKCTCKTNITISDEELTKKLEEIRKVLLIPKNSTKAFLRTKTSAYEDRPVAKGLGSIGIAIIVIVVTLIVCIDVSSLIAKRGRRLDKG
ncbi:hypothetical protein FSP39_009173 [Pinctada imbricata]|uniref:C-type lectin domain-containing protein n=1 Tax=Pinctada imbricata TaxID=66713 RepID=A0AA88YI02_PINIB|nr:hypothetical protein FSP39_009173 [Pinctada imbricata]